MEWSLAIVALTLLGVVVMSVNLLVDLAYGLINPRIRHAR